MTTTASSKQHHPDEVVWRLHFVSPPEEVFQQLSTDQGRARFWAESAIEENGFIEFRFPSGIVLRGEILVNDPPRRFRVVYFGGSVTTFDLESDGAGGTVLRLSDKGIPHQDYHVTLAGWVSVLMALKATVDFGVDLRNHDPNRSWDRGYVDN